MKIVILGVLCVVALGTAFVCAGCLFFGKKVGEAVDKAEEERKQDEAYVAAGKADMTASQFNKVRPTEAKVLRARIDLSNYWNYGYRGHENTHYSFRLDGFSHAWVGKDTPEGKRLHDLCKDGKEHWVTILVHRVGPDGAPTRPGDDGALIEKLIEEK